MHKLPRYIFLTKAANKYPVPHAWNIEFSLSQKQESYATINNNFLIALTKEEEEEEGQVSSQTLRLVLR